MVFYKIFYYAAAVVKTFFNQYDEKFNKILFRVL